MPDHEACYVGERNPEKDCYQWYWLTYQQLDQKFLSEVGDKTTQTTISSPLQVKTLHLLWS